MSLAQELTVSNNEDGMRLDRWFKQHFPNLPHGKLQKLLRSGQIRLDGGRAKSNKRLIEGQQVRVPPALVMETPDKRGESKRSPGEPKKSRQQTKAKDDLVREVQGRILFKNDDVLIIDKPAGLAVQGGSGLKMHLDGILDELQFEASERPRLVHRLDKDTSGLLALARSRKSAQWLTRVFRDKGVEKLYWAAVAGIPRPANGVISMALEKTPNAKGRETVQGLGALGSPNGGQEDHRRAQNTNLYDPLNNARHVGRIDDPADGKTAITRYRIVEKMGNRAAWLAMVPETGRTHQLRVHAAAGLGTPILGDGKYGQRGAFPEGLEIPRMLHLHARRLVISQPDGPAIDVVAEMPDHMVQTWDFLGFGTDKSADQFV